MHEHPQDMILNSCFMWKPPEEVHQIVTDAFQLHFGLHLLWCGVCWQITLMSLRAFSSCCIFFLTCGFLSFFYYYFFSFACKWFHQNSVLLVVVFSLNKQHSFIISFHPFSTSSSYASCYVLLDLVFFFFILLFLCLFLLIFTFALDVFYLILFFSLNVFLLWLFFLLFILLYLKCLSHAFLLICILISL